MTPTTISVSKPETMLGAVLQIASGVWYFYETGGWIKMKLFATVVVLGFVSLLVYEAWISGKTQAFDLFDSPTGSVFQLMPQAFAGSDVDSSGYLVIAGKRTKFKLDQNIEVWKLEGMGQVAFHDKRNGLTKGMFIPELAEYEKSLLSNKKE